MLPFLIIRKNYIKRLVIVIFIYTQCETMLVFYFSQIANFIHSKPIHYNKILSFFQNSMQDFPKTGFYR